jgi:hypothetical protein
MEQRCFANFCLYPRLLCIWLYLSNYSVSTDDLVQKKENNICAEATSKAAESKKYRRYTQPEQPIVNPSS